MRILAACEYSARVRDAFAARGHDAWSCDLLPSERPGKHSKLKPTNIVSGREARVHRMSPGPDRWKDRSRTYQGIADAMAEQWGRAA